MSIIQDGKKYIIMNVKSSTVIDLAKGDAKNGSRVLGWRLNTQSFSSTQSNQIWTAHLHHKDEAGDWFTLKNLASGTSLDLKGGHSQNGNLVQGWRSRSDNSNQQWLFRKVDESSTACYQIINRTIYYNHRTYACLDLSGGNASDGTKIQIWDARPNFSNRNQIWILIQVD